jgi:hypothetical protein
MSAWYRNAGVLMVLLSVANRSDSQASPPMRTASLAQTIRDDQDGADFVFGRISGLVVAKTGQMFVMDAGECDIKSFDARGKYQRGFGRAGGGPGELSCPGTDLSVDDSLIVATDVQQRRVSRFTMSGRFLETSKLAGNTSPTVMERSYALRNGTRLGVTGARIGTGASSFSNTLVMYDAAGKPDTLASIRSDMVLVMFPTGLGGPTTAGFGAGGAWALHRDSVVAVADGYAGVVRWLDVSRGPARVVRTERMTTAARPVTRADLAAMEARLRRAAPPQSQIRRPDATFVDAPTQWSVATRAVFGADGTLYVAGSKGLGLNTEWTVFPVTGASFRIRLPSAFYLASAQGNRLYGWAASTDGTPVVQVYEVR